MTLLLLVFLCAPAFSADRTSAPGAPRERAAVSSIGGLIRELRQDPAGLELDDLSLAKLAADAHQVLADFPGEYLVAIEGGELRLTAGERSHSLAIPGPGRVSFSSRREEDRVRGLAAAFAEARSAGRLDDFIGGLYGEQAGTEAQAVAILPPEASPAVQQGALEPRAVLLESMLERGRFDAAIDLLEEFRSADWAQEHILRPVLKRHLRAVHAFYASTAFQAPLHLQVKIQGEKDYWSALFDNVIGRPGTPIFQGVPRRAPEPPPAALARAPMEPIDTDMAMRHYAEIDRFIVALPDAKKEQTGWMLTKAIVKPWLWALAAVFGSGAVLAVMQAAELPGWTYLIALGLALYAAYKVRPVRRMREYRAREFAKAAWRHGWRPPAPPAPLARNFMGVLERARPAEPEPPPQAAPAKEPRLAGDEAVLWEHLRSGDGAVREAALSALALSSAYLLAAYLHANPGSRDASTLEALRGAKPGFSERLERELSLLSRE